MGGSDRRDFAGYLESLAGSWQALAAPHADAEVIRGAGFIASRFPRQPVFNNAALLRPAALPAVTALFAGMGRYALWSHDADTAYALAAAGMRPDEVTVPMRCELGDVPRADGEPVVLTDADPGTIAALNGVGADLLRGVPGVRAFATACYESGLVLIPVGADVNVSFVATRPEARRRGLATAVLRTALTVAAADGYRTASLQATPMAERVYAGLGFTPVGAWQEWVPAD